jgi:hypothetical protein
MFSYLITSGLTGHSGLILQISLLESWFLHTSGLTGLVIFSCLPEVSFCFLTISQDSFIIFLLSVLEVYCSYVTFLFRTHITAFFSSYFRLLVSHNGFIIFLLPVSQVAIHYPLASRLNFLIANSSGYVTFLFYI